MIRVRKPMPGAIYLYVNDTDAIYKRALQAGATPPMKPATVPTNPCSYFN